MAWERLAPAWGYSNVEHEYPIKAFFPSSSACVSWLSWRTLQKISLSLFGLVHTPPLSRLVSFNTVKEQFPSCRLCKAADGTVTLSHFKLIEGKRKIVFTELIYHMWLPASRRQKTQFFCSLTRKWLAMIPTARMTSMTSSAPPRRKTSCGTERMSPTVVVVDLFCSGRCTSWYALLSSVLSQLGAAVRTWARFWFKSGGLREKLYWQKH